MFASSGMIRRMTSSRYGSPFLKYCGLRLSTICCSTFQSCRTNGPVPSAALFRSPCFDARLADDEAPESAERREEPGEGLLRHELHGIAPRWLDPIDGDEVRPPRRFLEEPIERELDVRGGQLLAIVEGHALAELEGPREPVRADLPGLGQLRHGVHLGVEADELVVHHRRAPAPREGRDELRVESRRLGRLRRDEGAARLRRLRVRGRLADRERGEGSATGLEKISTCHVSRHRGTSCGSFTVPWLVRC